MGNSYALKIKKIQDNNLLKDIIFGNNHKIVEYVYYITKINKFYVENFRKGTIISEFTILNIFTRKEHNIVIERVEAGFFFEGLEYSLEQIPNIERILFVSNTIENSISYREGISPGNNILIGNETKYFNSLLDVEKEILEKKSNFIFYNFVEEKIVKVDYEKYRESHDSLRMGFEIEEKFTKEIFVLNTIKNKTEQNNAKSSNNSNNHEVSEQDDKLFKLPDEIKENDLQEKEILNENINDRNFNEMTIQKIKSPKNSTLIEKFEENIVLMKSNSTNYSHLDKNFNILEKEEIYENKLIDTLDNESLKEFSENKIALKKNFTINFNNSHKQEYNTQTHDLNQKENKLEKKNSAPSETSEFSEKSEELLEKASNMKYNFKQAKKKYIKFLSIYDKIDSNFNFMNISKKVERKSVMSLPEIKINLEERKTEISENSPILNKNKHVILIKGFFLTKSSDRDHTCLKISSLDENTHNVK